MFIAINLKSSNFSKKKKAGKDRYQKNNSLMALLLNKINHQAKLLSKDGEEGGSRGKAAVEETWTITEMLC